MASIADLFNKLIVDPISADWDYYKDVATDYKNDVTNTYKGWRNVRQGINEAGYFLRDPKIIKDSSFENWLAQKKFSDIKSIINTAEGTDMFKKAKSKTAQLNIIRNYVDPNIGNDKVDSRIKNDVLNSVKNLHSEYMQDPDMVRQRMYDKGYKLPGTNMHFNTELAKQRLGMLKGLGKLSALQMPLLAYDMYKADDKQGVFEDFIGWRSNRDRARKLMRAVPGYYALPLEAQQKLEEKLNYIDDTKSLAIVPYISNAGIGAGIGALGGWATGAGIGTGAATGAVAGIAPLAALAAGYGVGSYIDQATGASDAIADLIWDLSGKKVDAKDASYRDDDNFKKQIEFYKRRDKYIKEDGYTVASAADRASKELFGTPSIKPMNTGLTPPKSYKDIATNYTTTSGVNFLTDKEDRLRYKWNDELSNKRIARNAFDTLNPYANKKPVDTPISTLKPYYIPWIDSMVDTK